MARIGPWLTPAVVLIEVVLVASGVMRLRDAVIALVVIEVVFALVAGSRMIVAARSYRAGRAAGYDSWTAAEDGLAEFVPRKLARVMLIEPRLMACLGRWVTGRHNARAADAFGYHRGLRPLLFMIIALVVVEGLVVDVLIGALWPSGPWVWIALALHVWAVIWLLGFYASLVVRPHELLPDGLHLRDGIFAEVVVPYPAITGARAAHRTNLGRSSLKIDDATGVGLLAMGDATVTLTLDPTQPIGPAAGLSRLDITVDDPGGFLEQLQHRREVVAQSALVRMDRIPTTSPSPAVTRAATKPHSVAAEATSPAKSARSASTT